SVAIVEVIEADCLWRERAAYDTIEPAAGADPDGLVRIDVNGIHGRATQGAGIACVMLQVKEPPVLGVEHIQASAVGTDPETSGGILSERGDPIAREAPGVRGIR